MGNSHNVGQGQGPTETPVIQLLPSSVDYSLRKGKDAANDLPSSPPPQLGRSHTRGLAHCWSRPPRDCFPGTAPKFASEQGGALAALGGPGKEQGGSQQGGGETRGALAESGLAQTDD